MIRSFALRQAARETRASWRRVGLYMGSITLGVAALVAINSFRANVEDSVGASGRELLGSDIRLRSSAPFPRRIQAVLDSLARAGHPVDYAVNLASMALAPRTGLTRLVQVRATGPTLPMYGRWETDPPGAWAAFRRVHGAVVDPPVLLQLGIRVGDSIAVGTKHFQVLGTLQGSGGEVLLQNSLAPRVYIPLPDLQGTGLLAFGSLARYEAYVKLPRQGPAFGDRYREIFRSASIGFDTAEHMAEEVTEALGMLSKFLGLVGLAALLLGGVGVASAIHVFIKGRLQTVAVLRCLGATQRSVFGAYLLQSAFLGLGGAAAGALLGIFVQALLPRLLAPFLSVQVPFALSPAAILAGLATGVWVAAIFALIPLLGVRDVAPLQALRHDYEPPRRRFDWRRLLAYVVLVASLLALSMSQAPTYAAGVAFAVALATVGGILWLLALGLVHATRRFFPARARYVIRQGISNLFRPHNQTAAITLSLGFGIFLVATLYLVHGAILDRIAFGGEASGANLLLFDVQPTQLAGVRAIMARHGAALHDATPIVPARIASINGRTVEQILATLPRPVPGAGPRRGGRGGPQAPGQPQPWALRREYRNTYRDSLVATEQLVAGKWWARAAGGGKAGGRDGGSGATSTPGAASASAASSTSAAASTSGAASTSAATSAAGVVGDSAPLGSPGAPPALISVDEGLARDLAVRVGDTITWSFNGLPVRTVVANLRRVQWARFSPNFFVVFQPGAIEDAPQSLVALARVAGGDTALARVQTDLVRAYPGISTLDMSLVQRTLDSIVGKVTMAIRFLALFSLGAGLIVLIGALATSRFQRVRESALLKTLGATRRQLLQVLFTEYAALGVLAGLAGTLLAVAGGWGLVHFFFKFPFRPPLVPLLATWMGIAALTVAVGLLNSRDVLRRPPLAVLREAE